MGFLSSLKTYLNRVPLSLRSTHPSGAWSFSDENRSGSGYRRLKCRGKELSRNGCNGYFSPASSLTGKGANSLDPAKGTDRSAPGFGAASLQRLAAKRPFMESTNSLPTCPVTCKGTGERRGACPFTGFCVPFLVGAPFGGVFQVSGAKEATHLIAPKNVFSFSGEKANI